MTVWSISPLRRVLTLALLLGLVAAACGGSSESETVAAPAEQSTETAAPAEEAAASSSLLTGSYDSVATGETIDLSTFEGQEVVLWFWAPW